ncbi:MAG: metal-binding protein [Candidatus Thermoplasmatota archaeon]|jgi:hypothetical protein|nr:metal-binding protein [Candidatus Thermoplasmatota archaeon]
MEFLDRIKSFSSIEVIPDEPDGQRIRGIIRIRSDAGVQEFSLIFHYSRPVKVDRRMAGIILTMPVINHAYFAQRIKLSFPVSALDLAMIRDLVSINNVEVFVNKICRRRYEFFKPKFLPREEEKTPENAIGNTEIESTESSTKSNGTRQKPYANRIGILSSGGKESLLSYGILKEIGIETYPIFFAESGGHWRTAKTSYDQISLSDPNTTKIWSNVDRYYSMMLRNLKCLDQNVVRKRADTYPVRLFIFPVYVMASLPLVANLGLSGLVMGNEFDDPREMPPYNGIRHYYGIYDQSQDFADRINKYFSGNGYACELFSILYPVLGNVVQNMLGRRYPDLFRGQRSCHSCHFSNGKIEPCGKCTKCIGIMLFASAAGLDLESIGYHEKNPESILQLARNARMRLDQDELAYLLNRISSGASGDRSHVTGLHMLPGERNLLNSVREPIRSKVLDLLRMYTSGTFYLQNGKWVEAG